MLPSFCSYQATHQLVFHHTRYLAHLLVTSHLTGHFSRATYHMDTIHASKYLEVFPRGPLLAAKSLLHQVPAVHADVLDRRYHVKPTFKKNS